MYSTPPKLKQQTVLQLFEKSASYDGNIFKFIVCVNFVFYLSASLIFLLILDGGERHTAIIQNLVYMIIKDNLPLSCVEKEGLKKFVYIACPRYKLPSRFKVNTLDLSIVLFSKNVINHIIYIRNSKLISNNYSFLSN